MNNPSRDIAEPRTFGAVALVRGQRGQATAEYALVLVAAATVALALIVWASTSDVLPTLFNAVVRSIRSLIP